MTVDLGADISTPTDDEGLPDLDPFFRVVTGRKRLAQALARRLSTPQGDLARIGDDPTYGYDLRALLNDTIPESRLPMIAARVTREIEADECVDAADVTVTLDGTALRVTCLVSTAEGPLRLVLAVTAVTVEILAAEPL